MCIRDSDGTALTVHTDMDKTLASMARFSEKDAGTFQRLYGCLLYTSDAADERSSVDLGGRRIIKKKKNDEDWSACMTT